MPNAEAGSHAECQMLECQMPNSEPGIFCDQLKTLIRGGYRPYRIKALTAPEAGSGSGSRPRLFPLFQP